MKLFGILLLSPIMLIFHTCFSNPNLKTGLHAVFCMPTTRRAIPIFHENLLKKAAPGTGYSESGIVYSAQFFRLSKTKKIRWESPNHHLFIVNPSHSRRVQITYGAADDRYPKWSPDKKQILFIRHFASDLTKICIMSLSDGKTRSVFSLKGDIDVVASWSPTGTMISAKCIHCRSSRPQREILIINPKSHKIFKFADAGELVWSPNGQEIYVGYFEAPSCIENLINHKVKRITSTLLYPVWLTNNTILGIAKPTPMDNTDRSKIRIIDDKGVLIRSMEVDWSKFNEAHSFNPAFDRLEWFKIPDQRTSLILECVLDKSDGEHSLLFEFSTKTAAHKYLGNYEYGGFSPTKIYFAASTHEWIGAYKHGGFRLGSLIVMNFYNGKSVSMTKKLTDICGACWAYN